MKGKYCPGNGSEGMWFTGKFCGNCIHDNPDYEAKAPRCDILTLTMCCSPNDEEYPSEWTYDDGGNPICTKFSKWDWENDGDPLDLDNPKAPMPFNPNQLIIPFGDENVSTFVK